jgi:hypothetical protein
MSQPVNPYASPVTVDPYAPRMAEPPSGPPFQSGVGRARLTMIMLAICAVMNVLLFGSTAMELSLLMNSEWGSIDPAAASANDLRQFAVVMLLLLAMIITMVSFSFWLYRAYQNLPALGAQEVRYSPGWAVGFYFIPILNLFRPCQAMLDIWRGSDPARVPPLREATPATLVGWWWGLWIVAGIVDRIESRISLRAEGMEEVLAGSWLSLIGAALGVPLSLCALWLVRTVDRHQTARYEKLLGGQPPAAQAPFV